MSTDIVVEVRAKEEIAPGGRTGSYIRGDRTWGPGWQQHVVSPEILTLISSDPWLEVRALTPRDQAKAKIEAANDADKAASAAESMATELRAKATALTADAKAAIDAAGNEPDPLPAPKATPFQDALRAAMPDDVRAQVERDQLAPMAMSASRVASQLIGQEVLPSAQSASAQPAKKAGK